MKTKRNISILLHVLVVLFLLGWFFVKIGHSTWNFDRQLNNKLQIIKLSKEVNYYSDIDAVKQIIKEQHPLKIIILSTTSNESFGTGYFRSAIVKINKKTYKIRMACYTYPLHSTPYEKWNLNQINFTDKDKD